MTGDIRNSNGCVSDLLELEFKRPNAGGVRQKDRVKEIPKLGLQEIGVVLMLDRKIEKQKGETRV